jgi:cytochrome c biogenesis factor
MYIFRDINFFLNKNYFSFFGDFILLFDNFFFDKKLTFFPEHRFYFSSSSILTKSYILSNFFQDFYLMLNSGNFYSGWFIRIYVKPFLFFIWFAFFLFGISSLLKLNFLSKSFKL